MVQLMKGAWSFEVRWPFKPSHYINYAVTQHITHLNQWCIYILQYCNFHLIKSTRSNRWHKVSSTPLLPNLSPSQFIVIRVIGIWAGGGHGGSRAPPKKNFTVGQKSNLKKFCYICENYVTLAKIFVCQVICLQTSFWYVRKEFFGISWKNFLVTRQQFWGEILMFSLPVREKYTVPPQTR